MTEVLIFLGACVIFLRFMEQRTVFIPYRGIQATPSTVGLEYKALTLVTQDRVRLAAWHIPASGAGRGTVLLMHGNSGNIGHRLEKAAFFHEAGFHVLLFDYRGYGESRGRPTEQGVYADAQAAYLYLTRDLRVLASQIILYGESLGGAVAIELARHHPVRAIIVEGSFTSIPAVSKRLLPLVPTPLLRYRFNSKEKVRTLNVPILILHSRNDEVVPYELGRTLYENAASKVKRFVPLRGAHNEAFYIDKELFRRELDDFLLRSQ